MRAAIRRRRKLAVVPCCPWVNAGVCASRCCPLCWGKHFDPETVEDGMELVASAPAGIVLPVLWTFALTAAYVAGLGMNEQGSMPLRLLLPRPGLYVAPGGAGANRSAGMLAGSLGRMVPRPPLPPRSWTGAPGGWLPGPVVGTSAWPPSTAQLAADAALNAGALVAVIVAVTYAFAALYVARARRTMRRLLIGAHLQWTAMIAFVALRSVFLQLRAPLDWPVAVLLPVGFAVATTAVVFAVPASRADARADAADPQWWRLRAVLRRHCCCCRCCCCLSLRARTTATHTTVPGAAPKPAAGTDDATGAPSGEPDPTDTAVGSGHPSADQRAGRAEAALPTLDELSPSARAGVRMCRNYSMVLGAAVMAWPFLSFPEATFWAGIAGVTAWDVFAVLAPCGPLGFIMRGETARTRAGRASGLPPSLLYDGGTFLLGTGDLMLYAAVFGRAVPSGPVAAAFVAVALAGGVVATVAATLLTRKVLPALPVAIGLGIIVYATARGALLPMLELASSRRLVF